LQQAVGSDVPLIGVGNIITPKDAVQAMEELDIPMVALGRELIVEPDWVEKVKAGKENDIRKVIEADNREDLMIPDAMWEYINSRPGWLPIVNK
ncbi:MAG: NADH-dependent flavin oxidoreductase, partial [Tetragenococcus halophilus]|nr:NADH-dependent flavin oxidoreductase [Tetragenococcus halophilus]